MGVKVFQKDNKLIIDTKYKCSFTGHRPDKLPWGYNESGEVFETFRSRLLQKVEDAINLGYTHFICGMALGADIICAETIIELKKTNPNIKLECAIPCKNQTKGWKEESIARYNRILTEADIVTHVSDCNYFNGCMQKRNRYMVDNASLLIAIYSKDAGGGTKQTIDYAKSKNKEIEIVYV